MTNKINYTTGITHTGVFHADDVFSTALLKILNSDIEISRVFKVPEDVPENTIVFDIGFGRFDHHQTGTEVRSNGFKYAAFGLLWREFGSYLVSNDNVVAFDKVFIQSLDDADNGGVVNAMYQTISSFVPNWDDEKQNMDNAFFEAVDFATSILVKEISRMQSSARAEQEVSAALSKSDGDIVILDRFVPWQDVLIPSTAKFVVFPSLRGGWSAQAIPSIMGGRDQKVPFPAEWAGADKETLGNFVPGMTFCHPGRFMIGTETAEQAVQACQTTLQ